MHVGQQPIIIFFTYLRQFLDPGEYGLSKDVDVAQWIEYRNYNKINEAPLREVFDFVVVNTSLHAEFDEFKRKETHHHYSILLANELLAYWNTYKRNPPLPVLRVYIWQTTPAASLH